MASLYCTLAFPYASVSRVWFKFLISASAVARQLDFDLAIANSSSFANQAGDVLSAIVASPFTMMEYSWYTTSSLGCAKYTFSRLHVPRQPLRALHQNAHVHVCTLLSRGSEHTYGNILRTHKQAPTTFMRTIRRLICDVILLAL